MTMKVEHEIHQRRLGRNMGVALLLAGFVAIVLGLTIVKVRQLGADGLQGFDHVVQPGAAYIAEDRAAAEAAEETGQ